MAVMGALNVSPESFYAGSVPASLEALVATALTMVEAGASIAWVSQDVRGHSIVLRDPEGNEFCVA